MQAKVIPVDRAVKIADAGAVRVAFVGIGGLRTRLEVEFSVEGCAGVGIDVAFTSCAISTKRAWRSGSLSFGGALGFGLVGMGSSVTVSVRQSDD